ncbi:MAG: DUF3606 domain-containing protein, partial [Mesorhizobium sp.]
MADDKSKRGGDRDRVSADQEYEIEY